MDISGKKTAIDPICGMEVDPAKTDLKVERGGKTFYFCAPACKEAFEKNEDYPPGLRVKDLICGMEVNPAETPFSYEHEGKKFFFCSEGCLKAFERKAAKIFKTKGAIGRWMDRLSCASEDEFGSGGPKCH